MRRADGCGEREYALPDGRTARLTTDEQRGRAGLTFGDPARETADLADRLDAIGPHGTHDVRAGRPRVRRRAPPRRATPGCDPVHAGGVAAAAGTDDAPRRHQRHGQRRRPPVRRVTRRVPSTYVLVPPTPPDDWPPTIAPHGVRDAADDLASRGFRPTAARTTRDDRGTRRSIDFADAEGRTATLDAATGTAYRTTHPTRAGGCPFLRPSRPLGRRFAPSPADGEGCRADHRGGLGGD